MPNYVTASGSNSILDQLTHLKAQGNYHNGGVPDSAMGQSQLLQSHSKYPSIRYEANVRLLKFQDRLRKLLQNIADADRRCTVLQNIADADRPRTLLQNIVDADRPCTLLQNIADADRPRILLQNIADVHRLRTWLHNFADADRQQEQAAAGQG